MSAVIFYEKPGCAGNAAQKALLRRQGFALEVRDLLAAPWTPETLRPFLGEMAVCDWFNLSAPRVKSGEVPINELDEHEALAMMIEDPLLIRRPLLQTGQLRQAGFEAGAVLETLGVSLAGDEDLQACPMEDRPARCGGGS